MPEEEAIIPEAERRRHSVHTIGEPESELTEPNMQDLIDEQRELEERASTMAEEDEVRSVAVNQSLDGVPPDYNAIRGQVQRRWERRHDAPYFAEFFLVGDSEETEEEKVPTGCMMCILASCSAIMYSGENHSSIQQLRKEVLYP